MTWALLTGAIGPHTELLALARPSFEAYAKRWDMEYIESPLANDSYPPSWHKIPALMDELGSYQGVIWVDADCVIVDQHYDLTIGARAPWNWTIHHIGDEFIPNCGVLVLQRLSETFRLLEEVWALRDKYRTHPWWEQAAAIEVSQQFPSSFHEMPLRVNVFPDRTPCDDPVIIHASGMAMPDRVKWMTWAGSILSQPMPEV